MQVIVNDIINHGKKLCDRNELDSSSFTSDQVYMLYQNENFSDNAVNKAYYDNEKYILMVLEAYYYARK